MNDTLSNTKPFSLEDFRLGGPHPGYIAGPMRGYPNYNYDAFNVVAAQYRSEGFEIINPAEHFGGKQDLDWSTYMREDLDVIACCVDFIIVLPGWESSPGALLEVAMAQAFGLPVFDANNRLPIQFSALQADCGFLAVSPSAQWVSQFPAVDEEDQDEDEDELYEDEEDYADFCEPESYDDDGSEYLAGYEVGLADGSRQGFESGVKSREDERNAMADLISVQTQRIKDLEAKQQTQLNIKMPSGTQDRSLGFYNVQGAYDLGYEHGQEDATFDSRLMSDAKPSADSEPQKETGGAVPADLLAEVIDVLDHAFYGLPESLDGKVLESYIDDKQLAKNDETCKRILSLMDALIPGDGFKSGGDVSADVPTSENETGGSILEEANALINGDRQATYGHPGRDFSDIAAFWSTYLGIEIHAHDVWPMMVMLKISRQKNGYKRDNVADIAGYAGCGEKIQAWVDASILPDYHPLRQRSTS